MWGVSFIYTTLVQLESKKSSLLANKTSHFKVLYFSDERIYSRGRTI